MTTERRSNWRRVALVCGCAIGLCGPALIGVARAQSGGLDMDASPAPRPAAPSQTGGLDMDVNPAATIGSPVVANPVVANPVAANPVPGSPVIVPPVVTNPASGSLVAASPGAGSSVVASPVAVGSVAAPPAIAPPVAANLAAGSPIAGNPVVANPAVTPSPGAAMPGDKAQNGIVPLNPTATPEQTAAPAVQPPATEQSASTAAGPIAEPEPVTLDHPTVIDTANLKAGGTAVTLFGIDGMQGEAAQGLQGYLASTEDRVICQVQTSAVFVCLLPDGTDLAQVALINGAARAKADAPEAYREQEIAAQSARRGLWASLPPPPVTVQHPVVQDTATLASGGQVYLLDGVIGFGQPYAAQLQGYIAAHGDSLSCQPQNAAGGYVCVLSDGTDIAKVALVNGAARVAAEAPDSYRVQQGLALDNRRGFWLNAPADILVAIANAPPPEACCVYVAGDDGADGITYVAGVPTAMIDGDSVFLIYGGDAGWGYYDGWHHWHDAPYRYRAHLDHYHPDGRGLRGYHNEAALHPGGARPGNVVHPSGMAGAPGHSGGASAGGASGYHPGAANGGRPGVTNGGHPGFGNAGFVHPAPSAAGFHPSGGVSHEAVRSGGGGGGGGGGKHH